MERPKCKLCSRTFANGRALGGHMKAHLATLPPPDSTSVSSASHFPGSSSRDSAYEEMGDDKSSIYGLRGNPRRSLKFPDPEFSSLIGAAPVSPDEEESEADSARRRRRPKRARRKLYNMADDEDAAIAMCLVMLSRDTRTAPAPAKGDVKWHVCEVCHKSFRSSQALGGHRVTHRKISSCKGEAEKCRKNFKFLGDDDESEKIFECPYCPKVFDSGQALGGHKRSHAIIGSENGQQRRPSLSSANGRNQKESSLIDLNLPASPEEDDDRSVVSDGEITGRI